MKIKTEVRKIDLHMHTNISDGTDTPEEILAKVEEAGIELFSVTDHDAIKAGPVIQAQRKEDSPLFIYGVEFSCRDDYGKYHILGYGYDPTAEPICSLVSEGHSSRVNKLGMRLEALKKQFGFDFSKEDIERLYANDNPGKPHIANMMVKYKYAKSKEYAFSEYLNRVKIQNSHFHPEKAIKAIAQSGGIPVLAHPSFGSGEELILGDEMESRLKRLMNYGVQGLEGYYSGFSPRMQNEILGLAEKYNLYVTAGSDYHGKNKMIEPGDTDLEDAAHAPEGLRRFLEDVRMC